MLFRAHYISQWLYCNVHPHKTTNTRLCFSRTFTRAHLQREISFVILSCQTLRHPQRGTKKHTTPLFTVQFVLCDTKSAVTLSQPVGGATQAQEIKCTVTNHNLSFLPLQWWKLGEKSSIVLLLLSYIGSLSLLVSSTTPAGYLFSGID